MSVIVSPRNACRPVSISYKTAPNAQMSARLLTGFHGLVPDSCRLPCPGSFRRASTTSCTSVTATGQLDVEPEGCANASPKSRTLTVPAGVIIMLAGFRSR